MTYTITPLIGEEAIRARVKELAASIDAAMAGRPYILLLLLNGALPFATMLKGHLKSRPVVKTVKITSTPEWNIPAPWHGMGTAGRSGLTCPFWWWMTCWIRALLWLKFAGN